MENLGPVHVYMEIKDPTLLAGVTRLSIYKISHMVTPPIM